MLAISFPKSGITIDIIRNKGAEICVQERGNVPTSSTLVYLIPSGNPLCIQTPPDLCTLASGY